MTKPALLLFSLASAAIAALPPTEAPRIRRFAVIVGKNDGGPGKARLKYAASDAQSVARVMRDLGGVEPADETLLVEPARGELVARLAEVRDKVRHERGKTVRNELLFYYSGHSNEAGILLGPEALDYRDLRRLIKEIAADVSIVVLDSCASGSLTRLKGGRKAPPFLTDALSSLKGYVALTSSSSDEAAQESDRIKGSYFTHYLVSGLRGAADTTASGRITLNDAYQYAYQQTLARTERTASGPQHPSYSIDLAGSGELIMTDLRRTSARLLLDRALVGRLFVRDASERIAAEVDKLSAKPMTIGLEPGAYSLILFKEGAIGKAVAKLDEGQSVALSQLDFAPIDAEPTVLRGEEEAAPPPAWRWDLTFRSGFAWGRISRGETITPGGGWVRGGSVSGGFIPFGLFLTRDLEGKLTFDAGLQVGLDFVNAAVGSLGLATGLALHVFGGAWQAGDRSPYNVSLVVRTGLTKYNVSPQYPDPYNPFDFYNGTALDVSSGVQFRINVFASGALTTELTTTLISVAAGNERVTANQAQLTVGYRALF